MRRRRRARRSPSRFASRRVAKWCQYRSIAGNTASKRSATSSWREKSPSGSSVPSIEQPVRSTSIGCASAGIRSSTSSSVAGSSRKLARRCLIGAQLRGVRQLAVEQQVGHLFERAGGRRARQRRSRGSAGYEPSAPTVAIAVSPAETPRSPGIAALGAHALASPCSCCEPGAEGVRARCVARPCARTARRALLERVVIRARRRAHRASAWRRARFFACPRSRIVS